MGNGASRNEEFGGAGGRSRLQSRRGRRRERFDSNEPEDDQPAGEDAGGSDEDPLQTVMNQIDLEFEISNIGDEVEDKMFSETYGVFPGPSTSTNVLRSAGLAQPGSWTERNVLAAGAKDAWSRRVAGNESEADYAVLRAARPGIASSRSGPISAAWTRAPWPGNGGAGSDELTDASDAVLAEMGL